MRQSPAMSHDGSGHRTCGSGQASCMSGRSLRTCRDRSLACCRRVAAKRWSARRETTAVHLAQPAAAAGASDRVPRRTWRQRPFQRSRPDRWRVRVVREGRAVRVGGPSAARAGDARGRASTVRHCRKAVSLPASCPSLFPRVRAPYLHHLADELLGSDTSGKLAVLGLEREASTGIAPSGTGRPGWHIWSSPRARSKR